MNKFIFLDFDGVLNSGNYQRQLREQKQQCSDGWGPLFDPNAVRNLERILDAVPEARIVIISSWKDIYGLVGLREMWKERCLPGEVHSVTQPFVDSRLLSEDLSDPEAFSRMEGESKAREVESWLDLRGELESSYVLIDDCAGFPASIQDRIVNTDPEDGLTGPDAEKAINILLNDWR